MKKNHCVLCAVITFMCLCFFVSCQKKKENSEERQTKKFAVAVHKAEIKTLFETLEFSGNVFAKVNVDVFPSIAGKVKSITVKQGEAVARNQVLAYIDASQPGFDFQLSPVKSPIDGTVTSIVAAEGMTVAPQVPIVKVGKINELEIQISVPERFISKIAVKQEAVLKLAAYPQEKFSAKVLSVSPTLDPLTRSMDVRLSPSSEAVKSGKIKAGMFAEVEITVSKIEKALTVPSSAIITRYGESFVFAVKQKDSENYIAEKTPVKTGFKINNDTQILSGLNENDIVAFKGQTMLSDGAEVFIAESTDATE